MTNEEKLNYIREMHKLSMKYRIDNYPLEEQDSIAKKFYIEFKKKIVPFQPQKLYRYRTVNDDNLNALENDYGWFSIPEDFDDTVDSTVNIDPEKEVEELLVNDGKLMYELNLEYAKSLFESFGLNISEEVIRKCLDCYEDGKLNLNSLEELLDKANPNACTKDKNFAIKQILEFNNRGISQDVKDATIGYLENFMNTNNNIRKGVLTYCLAEESDNAALWGTYADQSKGFCIEYTIPYFTDETSTKIRINLFPIYYGTKDEIKVFDMLKKSVFNKNLNDINGITKEDYAKMFISTYTKDKSWAFQKEWRITLPLSLGNKQYLPYVTSVILGERMSKEDRSKVIKICQNKGITIKERIYNSAKSKIIIKKI